MTRKAGNTGVLRFQKCQRSAAMALATAGIAFAATGYAGAQQQSPQSSAATSPQNPPGRHRDPSTELALKITAPFTIAAVGDILEPVPVSNRSDPGFQSLMEIIRGSDVGFANMEGSLVDMHNRDQFLGPIGGTLAPKEVGADIKAMGITVMNRANNHALDGEAPGMLSTDAILDGLGIVHAGSGHNLQEARAASFLDIPKGRVGVVGMFSIDSGVSDPDADNIGDYGAAYVYMAATERIGDMGGRPGINALRLTTYHMVSPEQMQTLRAFRDSYYGSAAPPAGANQPADELKLFDEWYKVGPSPGTLTYTMNPEDERGILESIRNGKIFSDFMIATIHAHDSAQNVGGVRTVSGFLVKLAHECIDNGADIFVTSGPHMLQGVEIYKGKPIFYGLAGFIFQTDLQLSFSSKGIVTAPGNEDLIKEERTVFGIPSRSEGMLATSRYEGGRLVEVRLHPVDLGGYAKPSSDVGIPTAASPELAQHILQEVQALSKPFGTTITIENNVGVIRVAPAGAGAK